MSRPGWIDMFALIHMRQTQQELGAKYAGISKLPHDMLMEGLINIGQRASTYYDWPGMSFEEKNLCDEIATTFRDMAIDLSSWGNFSLPKEKIQFWSLRVNGLISQLESFQDASFRASYSLKEEIFFQDDDLFISNKKVRLFEETIPINLISSARFDVNSPTKRNPLKDIFWGLVWLGIGYFSNQAGITVCTVIFLGGGLLFILFGIVPFFIQKKKYYAIIGISGGEDKIISSYEPEPVKRVVDAFNKVIAYR